MKFNYILKGHEPVPEPDLMKWAKWIKDEKNRRVAFDKLTPGIFVSTVFLGIDHNVFCERRPLLFETMVFKDGVDAGWQTRYCTWDEAIKGHQEAIAVFKEKLKKKKKPGKTKVKAKPRSKN